jgi:hypothetical protein
MAETTQDVVTDDVGKLGVDGFRLLTDTLVRELERVDYIHSAPHVDVLCREAAHAIRRLSESDLALVALADELDRHAIALPPAAESAVAKARSRHA